MDSTIKLVSYTYDEDELGRDIKSDPIETEILGEILGITRTEWRAAGQNNVNADIMFKTKILNYNGEKEAIVNGEKRVIYRTYTPPDSDDIELYLKYEGGVYEKN
ncbi:MAG: phage head closure protein [Lachnospiraceae bacterium]|nr:phage head closure protein [Lachnospiraceae bacterium]